MVDVSATLAFKLILLDNDAVSLANRLLNIVAVSEILTFKSILLDNDAVSLEKRLLSIDAVSAISNLYLSFAELAEKNA